MNKFANIFQINGNLKFKIDLYVMNSIISIFKLRILNDLKHYIKIPNKTLFNNVKCLIVKLFCKRVRILHLFKTIHVKCSLIVLFSF